MRELIYLFTNISLAYVFDWKDERLISSDDV